MNKPDVPPRYAFRLEDLRAFHPACRKRRHGAIDLRGFVRPSRGRCGSVAAMV